MICTARIGEGTLLKKRNRPFGWFRFFVSWYNTLDAAFWRPRRVARIKRFA